MWVHDTHLLSLCDPMTFTYSHSVWDDLVSRNWTHSWKTSGDLIWQPNTFQVFSCAVFSSVFLHRSVERVRGVTATSNATMVNSPEKKDVSWDILWLGMLKARHFQKSYKSPSEIRGSKIWLHRTTYHKSGDYKVDVALSIEILAQNHSIFRDAEISPQRNFVLVFFCIFFVPKTWKAASRRH